MTSWPRPRCSSEWAHWQELGLGVRLAIGLGSKKIALKKKKTAPAKSHKARKAVHHKVKHETLCSYVPVKCCTSTKQCKKGTLAEVCANASEVLQAGS